MAQSQIYHVRIDPNAKIYAIWDNCEDRDPFLIGRRIIGMWGTTLTQKLSSHKL